MKKPELIFEFYKAGELRDGFKFGKLYVRTTDRYLKFHASSGLSDYQSISNCWQKGKGGIPPCTLVSILNYTVNTQPISMPKKRGIEGNFYQIFPHLNNVKVNDKIYIRGDFGIHQDAGIQGTSGCIGITKGMHWHAFQLAMEQLNQDGIETIPLYVPINY